MNVLCPRSALLLALLIPLATSASTSPQNDSTNQASQDPLQQIPHTLKSLEEAKAGKYGKLRSEDKHRLNDADEEIQALTAGNRDLRTLNEQERTRLFNAQETIMAIVGGMKNGQLVCTYRQNAGTRFKTKQCVTRDIAEAQRKAGRDATRTIQDTICYAGEGMKCGR